MISDTINLRVTMILLESELNLSSMLTKTLFFQSTINMLFDSRWLSSRFLCLQLFVHNGMLLSLHFSTAWYDCRARTLNFDSLEVHFLFLSSDIHFMILC
mmetsp:Transcript_8458/g.9295  ORF Transcript_8458/g.9295 Transcript_8458/m.9295 type:complete len:100 (-) Transcript_8458:2015-2314(-)